MPPFPGRRWSDATTVDFARFAALPATERAGLVAVLPVGATEQHGPHLPVGVDAAIVDTLVERVIAAAAAEVPFVVLPTVRVGKSDEHLAFPGTLSIGAETLVAILADLAEGVRRAGIKKLVFLNGHGGQSAVLDVAARDARHLGLLAVVCNWWAFGFPDGLFPAEELRHGVHAGQVETSMMLAIAPHLVKAASAERFVPSSVGVERDYNRLATLPSPGRAHFGWLAQDLHPSGACGDAAAATAEAGERVLAHTTAALVELLAEVSRAPMSLLAEAPAVLIEGGEA
ncbi:MAG: creatininase family protein [Lacipirellulaceae bacterium]